MLAAEWAGAGAVQGQEPSVQLAEIRGQTIHHVAILDESDRAVQYLQGDFQTGANVRMRNLRFGPDFSKVTMWRANTFTLHPRLARRERRVTFAKYAKIILAPYATIFQKICTYDPVKDAPGKDVVHRTWE